MTEGLQTEIENLDGIALRLRQDSRWMATTLQTEHYLITIATDLEMVAKCLRAIAEKEEPADDS